MIVADLKSDAAMLRETAVGFATRTRRRLRELLAGIPWDVLVCDRFGHGAWPLGWENQRHYRRRDAARGIEGATVFVDRCRWCSHFRGAQYTPEERKS